MEHTKRNPDGLVTQKPIALRLMPEELREAESLASQAGISKSNLARQAFNAGLETVKNRLQNPPAAPIKQ